MDKHGYAWTVTLRQQKKPIIFFERDDADGHGGACWGYDYRVRK